MQLVQLTLDLEVPTNALAGSEKTPGGSTDMRM